MNERDYENTYAWPLANVTAGNWAEKYTRIQRSIARSSRKSAKVLHISEYNIRNTHGSQSQYVYFPQFANTWMSRTFCLTDVRRKFLKIYLQTLYETLPEGTSKTQILSQFCKRMVKLRTMKHDRLTDFFSQNFCLNSRRGRAFTICAWYLPTSLSFSLVLFTKKYLKYASLPVLIIIATGK